MVVAAVLVILRWGSNAQRERVAVQRVGRSGVLSLREPNEVRLREVGALCCHTVLNQRGLRSSKRRVRPAGTGVGLVLDGGDKTESVQIVGSGKRPVVGNSVVFLGDKVEVYLVAVFVNEANVLLAVYGRLAVNGSNKPKLSVVRAAERRVRKSCGGGLRSHSSRD